MTQLALLEPVFAWYASNREENDRIWGEGEWVMCALRGCVHGDKPSFHHREAKFSHG